MPDDHTSSPDPEPPDAAAVVRELNASSFAARWPEIAKVKTGDYWRSD